MNKTNTEFDNENIPEEKFDFDKSSKNLDFWKRLQVRAIRQIVNKVPQKAAEIRYYLQEFSHKSQRVKGDWKDQAQKSKLVTGQ